MNRLLSLAEMASQLNRTPKTFRKYVIKYGIPHVRLGSSLMFDAVAVLNHLTAQESRPEKAKTVIHRRKKVSSRFAERLGI